ncbi:MAG: antitoxin [Myxococcota bacterium]
MSHRLQVLLDEDDYRRLRQAARREGTTVAEWVRRNLRAGLLAKAGTNHEKKLGVLRAAVKHQLPTADIDQMLEEIARGQSANLPE